MEGKPLTQICRDKDQPSLSTVYKWIAKHKDFASKLLTARRIGCQTYLDKMIEELEVADNKNIMVVREKLHHYRWLSSKLLPNVYGDRQISKGEMATVIGIFEEQYKNNKQLTVVRPGTQSRRFTHIRDTVKVCYNAWKADKCRHYSISNNKSFTILQVAKMFKSKIKYLPVRKGERYASALTSMNLSNKVFKKFGKINLKNYVSNFLKNNKKI